MINPTDLDIHSLPSVPLKYAQSLPRIAALYFCISGAELLYIGITTDLNDRWQAHHKVIQLVSFIHVEIHWLAIAPEQISPTLEREFINYCQPLLNDRTQHLECTQVYPAGWQTIRRLIDEAPIAAKIYSYLAENCDQRGALRITEESLADEINVTSRSIRTATKYLHDNGIVFRLKVGGNTYLYSLNPNEIWKSWDNKKDYAVFNVVAHVDKNDAHNKQTIQHIKPLYKI